MGAMKNLMIEACEGERVLHLEGQENAVLLYVLMQWLEEQKEEENVWYHEVLCLYHQVASL
jgi:hypothetical protein